MNAVGECSLDFGAGVQRAEHGDRADSRSGQFGCRIVSDGGQTKNLDMQQLAALPGRLQFVTTVVTQTERQGVPVNRLGEDRGMPIELVANGRANEIACGWRQPVPHHQIDMTKIDEAEVDCDFLAVRRLRPEFLNLSPSPSLHHLHGWYMDGNGPIAEISVESEEALCRTDRRCGLQRRQIGDGTRGQRVAGEQGFHCGGHAEDQGVAAAGADDLQAERHAVAVQPDRQRQRGVADDGDRVGHCEPVEIGPGGRAVDRCRVEFPP